MSVTVDRSHKAAQMLSINIGPLVCEAAGLEINERVDVFEGIDADSGTLMVERAPTGYRLSSAKESYARSIRLTLSKMQHYYVDGAPQALTSVEFSVDKAAGILIQVPDWLKYKQPEPVRQFARVLGDKRK